MSGDASDNGICHTEQRHANRPHPRQSLDASERRSEPCGLGTVVDSVSDAIRLTAYPIRPVPDFSSSTFDTKYITALGNIDQRMPILADIERLMSGADMALMEQAALQ